MVRLRHDDYTILLPDTMIWPGLFDVYAKSRFLRCMEPENRITSSLSVVTKQNFEAGKIESIRSGLVLLFIRHSSKSLHGAVKFVLHFCAVGIPRPKVPRTIAFGHFFKVYF